MMQLLGKGIGWLGGAIVIFYAIGFVTVQCYIYKHGFEGMFWLTDQFYRDAGAKFLLELVRAPLVAWHVVLVYAALLYVLLVPPQAPTAAATREGLLSAKMWPRTIGLVALMALSYVLALHYDQLLASKPVAWLIDTVFFDPTGTSQPQPKQSLAFFSMLVPLMGVTAMFLHRARASWRAPTRARHLYGFVVAAYVLFLSIVPIGYGMHLYDIKAVPVVDPRALNKRYADPALLNPSAQLWLIGEFAGRYVFLRKDDIDAPGMVETVDVKDVAALNVDLRHVESIKDHIPRYSPALYEESQAARVRILGLEAVQWK